MAQLWINNAHLWDGATALIHTTALAMIADLGLCFMGIYAVRTVYRALFTSPLRKLPGPWYTRLTGIVRMYYAWQHKEHHYFVRMFAKYGPIVRVGPDKVGIGEITMFRKMMSSHELTKSQMYEDFAVVGENIFTTRSPEFNKIRRRQLGPAFSPGHVHRMEPLVNAEGVDQVCRLFDAQIRAASTSSTGSSGCSNANEKPRAVTNLYHAFTMMATDVVSSLAFGHRFGAIGTLIGAVEAQIAASQQHVPVPDQEQTLSIADRQQQQVAEFETGETSQTILGYMIGTMALMGLMAETPFIDRLPHWILTSRIRQLYELRDRFMRFSTATVTRYRAHMEVELAGTETHKGDDDGLGGLARSDILGAFVLAQDPETGARMSDREIASENTVLLSAGTDTTANIMVNCIMLLLRHPEKMATVRNELLTVFPDGMHTMAHSEATARLPYLTAVIYETMRLRASTSGVWPRDSPRHTGITLGGYHIPPGTVICGSIGGTHLNPETWPLPMQFIPERFLGPDGEARRKNVVAFSTGIRLCPGRHLAMMELTATLSTVLRKYHFAPVVALTDSSDYFTQVDEVCHVTTTFRNPGRDCNFYVSHSD